MDKRTTIFFLSVPLFLLVGIFIGSVWPDQDNQVQTSVVPRPESLKNFDDPTVKIGERVNVAPLIAANTCSRDLSLRDGGWGANNTGRIHMEVCEWEPRFDRLWRERNLYLDGDKWRMFEGTLRTAQLDFTWEFNGSFVDCSYLHSKQPEERRNAYITNNYTLGCDQNRTSFDLIVVCPKIEKYYWTATAPSGTGIPECHYESDDHQRNISRKPAAIAYSNNTVLGALR